LTVGSYAHIILNVFNTEKPTAKAEQTRATILNAALQIFRSRGFDAATMREIADSAGMALGAAYYYFPSKEAIVIAYYQQVQDEHNRIMASDPSAAAPDFKDRLKFALQSKLDILQNDRLLLGALFRFVGEPSHPLSVFGSATSPIRQQSLSTFDRAIGDQKLPAETRAALPSALWALHLAILLFFIYDQTPNQQRTRRLVEGAVEIVSRLVKLASNPLLKPIRGKLFSLIRELDLLPAQPAEGAAQ